MATFILTCTIEVNGALDVQDAVDSVSLSLAQSPDCTLHGTQYLGETYAPTVDSED